MPRRKADAIEVVDVIWRGSVSFDGDIGGHEFRSNQYIGGGSYSSMSPEQKVKALLKAKKMLQPASKGKFSEAQLKSAENLIKHANAWKGKSAEKVAGVAPKAAAPKQAQSPKPTPYPISSPNAPASVAPPAQQQQQQAPDQQVPSVVMTPAQASAYTVGQQMEHTVREAPLSTDQYYAVKSYTGSGYTAINAHLRFNNDTSDETKSKIKHLDEAIKGTTLKEDRTVWRGINREAAKSMFGDQLKTGMVVSDKGFVSTSTEKGFARNWKGSQGVLLEIQVPKGASALDVHKISASGKQEAEILLPRGSQFKVESVDIPLDSSQPIKVRVSHVAA
jgi:hypothetical protein